MNEPKEHFDAVVLGGGIFGIYAARLLLKSGKRVLLCEADRELFSRASTVNQARLHLGYHYPRSLRTAMDSAETFRRFAKEFEGAVHSDFEKIYAISNRNSFTSGPQFEKFCEILGIPAEPVKETRYFRAGTVEACFRTKEYSFDAGLLLDMLQKGVIDNSNFDLSLRDRVVIAETETGYYHLSFASGKRVKTPMVINATYSGLNEVLKVFRYTPMELQYELAEVALGKVKGFYQPMGITLMDGPFFSVMPFGQGGLHSLTGVEYTPHETTRGTAAKFSCQSELNGCSSQRLRNCNYCPSRPQTSVQMMHQLAKKYLKENFYFEYSHSLYTVKTTLQTSILDDSRPTCLQVVSEEPKFMTVLSGKVSTLYELERVLR